MTHDKALVAEKLRKWEGFLQEYELPTWDMLPCIELYMDQVLVLLTQYLNFLPREDGAENITTPAMVNNYVKMKVLPPPVKKRYSRVHLAYLIMVCMLKQTLGISLVQQILPADASEDTVHATYDAFVRMHKSVAAQFAAEVRAAASPALLSEEPADSAVGGLILQAAIAASLFKLLTEKLVSLGDAPETAPPAAGGGLINLNGKASPHL